MTVHPTIRDAKAICDRLKARGVIVLVFSADNVRGASYGDTKAECTQMGYALDQIIDALVQGKIEWCW
jgi:hypothetical protein